MISSMHDCTGGRLVSAYVTWMRAAGRCDSTIATRTGQAQRLCERVDPLTATTADLLEILAHDGWKPATRASERAGVRAFFQWLKAAGHRADDPSADLPAVRVPPPVPHPAPEAALARARLLAPDPWIAATLELAAQAGLRRAEIATLRFSNVVETPAGPVLRITGKGRRTRVVPVTRALADMIEALRSDWVFPGRCAGTHIGANHVGEILSGLLGKGYAAHSLRHRYASNAFARSHDLLAVQQLLGHASVATTQGYVAVDQDSLRLAAGA